VSTDFLQVSNANSLPFTVSAWLRPTGDTGDPAVASLRTSKTDVGVNFAIGLNAQGARYLAIYTLPGSDWKQAAYTCTALNWIHVTWVFEETSGSLSRIRIFTNGASILSDAYTTVRAVTATGQLIFGTTGQETAGFKGHISDGRLYPSAFTDNQVAALYASYSGSSPYTCSPSCSGGTSGRCSRTGTGVCCSAGSACHTASLHPSQVLEAMGFAAAHAASTLRFSFSRFNTMPEVLQAADLVIEAVAKLHDLSAGGPVMIN
jgi:hypothetical protein